MGREPQLTVQTIRLLEALLRSPGASGAEIARETGLASGTLYPILLRLERAGWLASEWETEDATKLGRPRRRFYRVTGEGAAAVRRHAQEMAPLLGRLAWT